MIKNFLMPELPEVETVRRILTFLINKQKIERVEIFNSRLIKNISEKQFSESLSGETINKIERKGKYLFFILDKWVLISHLGMTGKYFVDEELMSNQQKKSKVLTIHLEKQQKLIYADSRGFGNFRLETIENYQNTIPYKSIGIDLLNEKVDPDYLFSYYQKRKIPIKIALLEQDVISGIGNIYASEILFASQIHPIRKTNELTLQEVKKVLKWTEMILKEAIELGGTSAFDFINPQAQKGSYQLKLKVYDRTNQPCYSCNNPIIQKEINGRSSFFCENCQK